MTADETDLIESFTRIRRDEEGLTHFEVAVVHWSGPASPYLVWRKFRVWKRPPSPDQVARAGQRALQTQRFFRLCERCGRLQNSGHMLDNATCQHCAATYLGVVF
jgi:hypothetical protein